MGKLQTSVGEFEYQWASDVDFNGIRLEILNSQGDVLFDVSISHGATTVNTHSREVPADLIASAVGVAREGQ